MSGSQEFETLLVEHDRGVTVLTLNRPERRNAFDSVMTNELARAMRVLDDDDAVRVIVVTGAGKAFSVGADISGGIVPGRGARREGPSDPVLLRPWELRTPVIAAINGAAVGMGLTYPLMWDIRIASEDAKMGFVFTRRGLVPEGNASWLLSRLVGASVAIELLLTGRIFSGAEAERLGLVSKAVPANRVLDNAVELAVDIAANTSPAATAVTKRLFYRSLEQPDRIEARREELEYFRWASGQPDAKEGVQAFLEKRIPEWTCISRDHLPEVFRREE
ncbi:enoyl-CoA hydratase-related protein [bacterium]|nr:enoyl-CoA hydratase-related protein [bacterium]